MVIDLDTDVGQGSAGPILPGREREVMRLIACGYAYKEVAKELFISIKTVETHMSGP